ncbi:hypothetical protein FHL15_007337 [Xylaria flabelliformis]|uniref:Uncharacterized protein n=1 Tax=Xylaria flabelliformis TaxID=2512241 RepID=A0A553HV09_9PEZI|nr:hypothetical protein FHL15_007337 [Xylaria flabelliformis]
MDKNPDPSIKTRSVPKRKSNQDDKDLTAGAPKRNRCRDNRNSRLHSKLSSWLDEVRISAAAAAEAAEAVQAVQAVQAAEEVNSEQNSLDDSATESSFVSRTTSETFDLTSVTGLCRSKTGRVSQESLRTRNIIVNAPLSDEWTPEFKKFLVKEPIEIPFEKTQDLQTCVKHFLEKAEKASLGDNSYEAIEELRENINKWTATLRLASVTNQEIENDLERCKTPSNATVFQRTIMMSIIDHPHLKSAFDFKLWRALVASGKPSSIIDSASQALYNIYMWMAKADHQAAFFKDVRLLSFAINTQQVIARAHRAVPVTVGGQTGLEFYYDELNANCQFYYTRDSICTFIHNILIDYAGSKLLGVIKAGVEKVLKEHKQDLKRQNDAAISLTKEVNVHLSRACGYGKPIYRAVDLHRNESS